MTIGGHFLGSGDRTGSPAVLGFWHFEEGIGYGRFPVVPPTFDLKGPFFWHIDAVSLDDIWVGGTRNAGSSAWYFHWDGSSWTRDSFPDCTNRCYVCVSVHRPSGNVFAAGDGSGVGWRYLWKYSGGAWVRLSRENANDGGVCPLALDADEFLWISRGAVGGVRLFHWSGGGYTQYPSGVDLEDGAFSGICQLGDEIFLYARNGKIWRGTWSGGFTHDNPTDGPFVDPSYVASLVTSADGSFIVGLAGGNYYIRNGPDDWINVGPTGTTGTQSQPAAINRQILMAGGSNSSRCSLDGGTTWFTLSTNSGYGNAACQDEISDPDKRLITLLESKLEDGILSWKGDDKYSPWARWSNYRADPYDVTGWGCTFLCVQGFTTGQVILGVDSSASVQGFWHYDPDVGDLWTVHVIVQNVLRIHGTEYAAGRIHGVGESGTLWYFRWTGSGYTESAIVGTTASGNLNIQASEDGEHIWIGSGGSQLMHSDDGGSSWVNRFAAAGSVHSDPGIVVKDVWVVSPTEVWAVIESTGGYMRFSKFDGTSWSVAAPDINEAAGSRCLFKDVSGDWWAFSSDDGAGGARAYKLSGGSWSLNNTFAQTHLPVGIEAFQGNSTIAVATESPNRLQYNDLALGLGWLEGIIGSNNLPSSWPWVDMSKVEFVDVTPPTITVIEPTDGETGIEKDASIIFEVTDDVGVVLSTVKLWVKGELIYSNERTVVNGWLVGVTTITDGYRVAATPISRSTYYRNNETVTARAYAEDAVANSDDELWSFDAGKNLPRSIYPMILESIRTKDEES